MSSRFENEKSNITFEDLDVFISPNGVIGGRCKKTNKEYILSDETADFVEVESGEAYRKDWKTCSYSEYCEVQKDKQYDVNVLKSKEDDYDPDWDLSEPFHEEQIEMLDLYFNKDNIIYGLNIEDECYVLDSSGYFHEASEDFVTDENDKKCKVYEAYERKAILLKESFEHSSKIIDEINKEIEEKKERIHYCTLYLSNYNYQNNAEGDLLAIDKKDLSKMYLLSSLRKENFIEIDNDDFTSLINSTKWTDVSEKEAESLIKTQNTTVDERKGKNTSEKLHDPSWWDDPEDYYYGEENHKLSYKIEKVFINL